MAEPLKGEWSYINTTAAPPSTGQVRLSSATQKNAITMWLHKITANSVDASNFLTAVIVGQELYIQDKDDSTKWQAYTVTAEPIVHAAYVEYPVIWVRGGIDVPQQRLMVAALPTSGAEEAATLPRAFPSNTAAGLYLGLTKRQYYAGQALMGLMANPQAYNMVGSGIVNMCFSAADRMMQYETREEAGELPPVAGEARRR